MKYSFHNQSIVEDKDGVVRFIPNPIVTFLMEDGIHDMNDIMRQGFPDEALAHFYQLIGYSVSGYNALDLNVKPVSTREVVHRYLDRLVVKIDPKYNVALIKVHAKGYKIDTTVQLIDGVINLDICECGGLMDIEVLSDPTPSDIYRIIKCFEDPNGSYYLSSTHVQKILKALEKVQKTFRKRTSELHV